MKKKLYALSGVFLVVLVVTGLWASKAGGFTDQDPQGPSENSKSNGVLMKEMARAADLIVIGSCTGTQTQWIDGRRLVTMATFEVTETMKGVVSGPLTVALPGGRGAKGKFQLAMTYAGAPTMRPGEEQALFLASANDEVANAYSIMGFNAGQFPIVQDSVGEKFITSTPMKVSASRVTDLTSRNPNAVRLSEFKAMVESFLR